MAFEKYNTFDLAISDDGELLLEAVTDDLGNPIIFDDITMMDTQLSSITSADIPTLKQNIMTRLRTLNPEMEFDPEVGADLTTFLGLPNERETGILIENAVKVALTFDNMIAPSDLGVRVVPIGLNEMLIRIEVRVAPGEQALILNIPFSTVSGVSS